MIYKIIVDKQPMNNPSEELKEYEVNIEELRYKGNVYDSLVITSEEDYVMRRLELNPYGILKVLETPIKQPIADINIELFEGDNYVYLYDTEGNRIVAEYLVKNEFNETYVTHSLMNSAISQVANAIELSVNAEITRVDGEVDNISANLELKVDKDDNDQVVSMINASADEIYLRSNRLVIDSTNFKLNDQGNITATGGNIADFNITNDALQRNISGIYEYDEYDFATIPQIIIQRLPESNLFKSIYDYNDDGDIDTGDWRKIYNILHNILQNTRIISGSVQINSNNPKNCIEIKSGSTKAVSIGVGGIDSFHVSCKSIFCGEVQGNDFSTLQQRGVIISGDMSNPLIYLLGTTHNTQIDNNGIATDGYIHASEDSLITADLLITGNTSCYGTVTCTSVIQTSKEESKKNFEKLPSGLDIIKNVDIYKYNMKAEEDDTKKHIGFVIGDKYKYSEEITSKDNDGVDIYSFVSVCCKAIQEQQEEIEELKKRIEKLEKGE